MRLKVGQTLQFRLSQVFTTQEGKSREIWFSDDQFFLVVFKGEVGDPSLGAPKPPPSPLPTPSAEGRGRGADVFCIF